MRNLHPGHEYARLNKVLLSHNFYNGSLIIGGSHSNGKISLYINISAYIVILRQSKFCEPQAVKMQKYTSGIIRAGEENII